MREQRSFAIPLEFRNGGDGRTVGGLVVPYGTPTEIRDRTGSYTEVFRPGAFAKTIAERGSKVKLFIEHSHQQNRLPIGRATSLVDTKPGVLGDFYVSRTRDGDEALELIRDGALDAFSVGFEPIQNDWTSDRSAVERVEARLWEVSLVGIPAYEDALVSSVRSDSPDETPESEETEDDVPDPEDEVEGDESAERRREWFQRTTAAFDAHLSRLKENDR